jgi:hypothetical protein
VICVLASLVGEVGDEQEARDIGRITTPPSDPMSTLFFRFKALLPVDMAVMQAEWESKGPTLY